MGLAFAVIPLLLELIKTNSTTLLIGLLIAVLSGWTTPFVMKVANKLIERYKKGEVAAFLTDRYRALRLVLLVCLELKQFMPGFTLVLAFSFGLARTMVAPGTVAAWGVQHASKRIEGFGELVRKAPYFPARC